MKIYHNQLAKNLSQPLSNIWLVFGDEPWQKNDALAQIKHAAGQQGFIERINFTADDKFNWQDVLDEYLALSLFASQRIIEVELINKVNEAGGKVLLSLLDRLHQDVILIFHGAKLDAATTNKKWFKGLNEQGIYLPVYDLDNKNLSQWLGRQAQHYQLNLPTETKSMLMDLFEGNVLALDQELQKLAILFANQQISEEEIEQLAIKQARFNPFQLVDALLRQDLKKCLSIIDQLKQEGTPIGQLVWVLHKEINTLKSMLMDKQKGLSLAELFKKHRVWKNKENLYKTALSGLSLLAVQQALSRLASIDLISKTSSDFDTYILLSDLCISLYQPASLQALSLNYEFD